MDSNEADLKAAAAADGNAPVNAGPPAGCSNNRENKPVPDASAGGEFVFEPGRMAMPVSNFLREAQKNPSGSDGIGRVLQNRYKIEGILGRGGFGTVYKVSDLRLPGKTWALKELQFQDSSQLLEAKRSFEREARLLSTLIHRSLPVIVDYFSEGGSTYLLMEEVDGSTLEQIVSDRGPLPEIDVLRWGLETARVLEYLHSQKPPVIYRDLKPGNIMIDSDGHVKLIDFGLARFFNPYQKRDTAAVGSVGYAPPEVWGDSTQTDARSDIYSFGATLYFALTGKAPAPTYNEVHKISPYRNGQKTSKELEKLVLRCMECRPEDRCENMGQVITALINILSSAASDDPALRDELRTESFRRAAARSVSKPRHVVVASANSGEHSKTSLLSVRRASSAPKSIAAVCILCTLIFLIGAWTGWKQVSSNHVWEFDTPYELVNPDKEVARGYIEAQDWTKAAQALDLAVTRHPSDAEAHIMRQNVAVYIAAQLNGKKYFRIPAFMTITGISAPEGYRLLYGIAMAQKNFNRDGGDKNGRLAVVDIYDDHSNMEKASETAYAIAGNKEYLGVIGPFSSQFSLALAPFFNSAGLPILTPVVSAPGIWEGGPCIFTASDTNAARCRAVARYMYSKGCRNVGVVVDRDSVLSADVASFFESSFREAGGTMPERQYFSNVNFSKVIDTLVSQKVDGVFFSDYRGTPLAMFSKELRRRGIRIPIASQVAPFTKDLVAVGGNDVEGLILSGYFHSDSSDPLAKEYSKSFRALFGGLSPSHLDATAYDAANIIFSAYKDGVKSRDDMRRYLSSIGADTKDDPQARPCWRGATGTFSLARMLDIRDVYLIEIKGGRYDLIKVLKEGKESK